MSRHGRSAGWPLAAMPGALLVALLMAVTAAAQAAPTSPAAAAGPPRPAGRQPGELCVSTAGAPPQCGPAELTFRSGAVRVQVSDIVYHLKLRSSQADVVLMHGPVQIDGFIADYDWAPQSLRFSDPDKAVRYEVRWPQK